MTIFSVTQNGHDRFFQMGRIMGVQRRWIQNLHPKKHKIKATYFFSDSEAPIPNIFFKFCFKKIEIYKKIHIIEYYRHAVQAVEFFQLREKNIFIANNRTKMTAPFFYFIFLKKNIQF